MIFAYRDRMLWFLSSVKTEDTCVFVALFVFSFVIWARMAIAH